jgi:peptidyl-tRNA hydrolase, PTH2 family
MMKQVIVVNQGLKLPKGKLAAQVAHAAVGALLEASLADQQAWLDEGMPKVVLRAESAEDLLRLAALARERGLPSCLVEDAGRTVIPEGTLTCIGIGPAEDENLDALTGNLKLL